MHVFIHVYDTWFISTVSVIVTLLSLLYCIVYDNIRLTYVWNDKEGSMSGVCACVWSSLCLIAYDDGIVHPYEMILRL